MKYCPDCGSQEIVDMPLERHESWYYCNGCKTGFGELVYVPKEEIAEHLKEDGYPKDAERALKGESLSKGGE